ncbi:MAG: porin [Acetobacteraceae bacterium]|nr:porin [Acetobacteraceae bacterium]
MRKFLLATAAGLGIAAGSTAVLAEDVADSIYGSNNDDSGQAAPAPGTITVRLNGRFRFFAGWIGQSDANRAYYYDQNTGFASETPFNRFVPTTRPTGSLTTPTTLAAAGYAAAPLTYNKLADYGFGNYFRLYPGFDGVAANGLRYGASVEIRQDNNGGAGAGRSTGGGVYGSISGESVSRGLLYIRREWGYIGTDRLGTLRVGSTDGPSGLFMVGNFENFNDGGWNGDAYTLIAGNIQPLWPFADVGQMYTTTKAIYLSPQFYGFDFGIAFEPNTGNDGNGATFGAGCNAPGFLGATYIGAGPSVAGAGCDDLASTSTADYARRRNTVDAAIRYRGTFGPVGFAAYANYIGSGKVQDSTPRAFNALPSRFQYNGFNVGVGGAAVTFAGFTVGGMIQGGAYNGQWSLKPQGASDATAWLAGASYTLGPAVVGASYFASYQAGASGPLGTGPAGTNFFSPFVGQRRERGVAAGGTYSLAPGLALFLGYLRGDRKENGFDFITGQSISPTSTTPTGAGSQNNYVHSSELYVGTSFTW